MRKFISIFLLICLLVLSVSAETVYLKKGRTVEGKIIAETDEYIKLDVGGINIKYWRDEIDHLQAKDSQSFPEDSVSAVPLQKKDKTFLWKITSQTNIAYILGSIHLANRELYPLDKKIEQAFEASNILVVEIDLSAVDPLAMQIELMEKGLYPGEDRLKDHLSEETLELVSKKLQAVGLNMEIVDKHKPWFLAMSLMTIQLLRMGLDPNYGIDSYFLRKAKGNKKILELEGLKYQLGLFDSFTDKEQELFLISTLLELDIMREELKAIIKAWKKGDARALKDILERSFRENPKIRSIYDKLFSERNRKMALKIEEFLATNDIYFVIAGAGHLVGEEGIINLLRMKGYSLEQM